MNKFLKLYDEYRRCEVRDLFEPDATCVIGRGKWGLRGIIQDPNKKGDFILFVTYGRREKEHHFVESIDIEGIFRWQSEPSQTQNKKIIKKLFQHDSNTNTIYLFLRTSGSYADKENTYTYLGPLRYIGHDRESNTPVHIAWELIQWPIPNEVLSSMSLKLIDYGADENRAFGEAAPVLIEEDAPVGTKPVGDSTSKFRTRKVRYQSCDQSRALGLAGEMMVLERERADLTKAGRKDLADRIEHVSLAKGDGAGFDILSFYPNETPKYIEVKTTTGSKHTSFFISPNEIAFSEINSDRFELYRVFDYNAIDGSAQFYRIRGSMKQKLNLTISQYKACVAIKTPLIVLMIYEYYNTLQIIAHKHVKYCNKFAFCKSRASPTVILISILI